MPYIVFCRVQGLVAHVAAQARCPKYNQVPLAVAEGKIVRDVTSAAESYGVKAGQSITQARRFCPALLVVPLTEVNYTVAVRPLLEILAEASPVVEPVAPSGAYADLAAFGGKSKFQSVLSSIARMFPAFSLTFGSGKSKLAARATAECGLTPEQLDEASVKWLWPEEAVLTATLLRLGLMTFGAVREVTEPFLVYQFGKKGRLLYKRACGEDMTPVQPLYPPLRVDLSGDFQLDPIVSEARLSAEINRLAAKMSEDLRTLSRFGRRIQVVAVTEQQTQHREAVLATPLQSTSEISSAVHRLVNLIEVDSAIVNLRLLMEDLDVPQAVTQTLFDTHQVRSLARLDATKRHLVERFGHKSLMTLQQVPISARQERRSRVAEVYEAEL